jgi:signal transduction histidine kinase
MRSEPRARVAAAIAVWALSWLLVAASALLFWSTELPADPLPEVFLSQAPPEIRRLAYPIDVTVALVYGPASALVLARRPHPVGIALACYAIGSGLSAFAIPYGLLGAHMEDLPLWGLIAYAAGWGFVPGTFFAAAVPLLVTRARLPGWQRAIVIVTAMVAVVATVLSLTNQGDLPPRNPLGIDAAAYQVLLPPLYTALSGLVLAISLVSCGVVVARWRRVRRRRARFGLAWLAVGQLFVTASYLAQALPEHLGSPRWVLDFALLTPVIGQILFSASIVVVILGERLWGVDIVVSRVLLWLLLTVSGVVLYLAVVAVVPAALDADGALAFVVPVVIALAVLPLRAWLQRRIDRLVYGEGADPGTLLARLGERIGTLPPGTDGIRELADTLRRVLRLGRVEIRTPHLTAASGREEATNAVHTPLLIGDTRIGELSAGPLSGQRLDRRTRIVLTDVAGLVATVVRLAESHDLLDAARADLATRRADERRAIRRELHDGLGPALAGTGFALAAVENLAAGEPDRARALLGELADDMRARAQEVRALAEEVSVPRFESDELPEMLSRLARRFSSPRLQVRSEVSGADDLPRHAAQTLYFVAAEAVANAVRHADPRRVTVRLHVDEAMATLEVVDDGSGVSATASPGVGMASMRERAVALGGELSVTTDAAGTSVRVTVALDAATAGTPS